MIKGVGLVDVLEEAAVGASLSVLGVDQSADVGLPDEELLLLQQLLEGLQQLF